MKNEKAQITNSNNRNGAITTDPTDPLKITGGDYE